jgi:transglutaminase-like putative cysteine protease
MPEDKAGVVMGAVGFGMVLLGGVMFWRARTSGFSGLAAGLGRARFAQAPAIGRYSDGNMKTILRSSRDMPIEQRIATIQDLIHKSVQDPQMRKIALQITANCPERDQMCEAEAIYNFTKAHVRYTGDVGPIIHPDGSQEGIDLYQSARRTIEFAGGDCDDQAILNATLDALNGLEPRLRVVKQRGAPDWEHIYAGVIINGRFVAQDTTLPGHNRFNYEARTHKQIDFPA